ncbi:hypothetical protein 2016_scaffold57_00058 [Bacteriophage sp.]|nr:hypothetical protein 2016_scaffold57_00058 [Bacteriophage sp.]
MPLPQDTRPISVSAGSVYEFFAASTSSSSVTLLIRPRACITIRETCWYSSGFGNTLRGISVTSTQP